MSVIGALSKFSENDVMTVVAPVPGHTIEPADLIALHAERIAYFMVPRYIRIFDDLPKTPSVKVQKTSLRSAGVAADTWDREAGGLRLRREQLRC